MNESLAAAQDKPLIVAMVNLVSMSTHYPITAGVSLYLYGLLPTAQSHEINTCAIIAAALSHSQDLA